MPKSQDWTGSGPEAQNLWTDRSMEPGGPEWEEVSHPEMTHSRCTGRDVYRELWERKYAKVGRLRALHAKPRGLGLLLKADGVTESHLRSEATASG